jgi:uncharacterized protein (TIGR02147 family)
MDKQNNTNIKKKNLKITHRPSAFDFSSISEFIVAIGLPNGRYNHKSDNLKELALKLGYRSPSTLTMIIKEQRLPSKGFIKSLADTFKLSAKEKNYLFLLLEKSKKEMKGEDLKETLLGLKKYRNNVQDYGMDLNKFEAISNWYYSAITQMIEMDNFIEDAEWVSRQLVGKVKPSQIRLAIDQMLDLGILKRDKKNKLKLASGGWRLVQDIPSSAIRNYHSGLIELAGESLHSVDPESRHMMGLTLPFDSDQMEEAKDFIQNFIMKFNRKFANNKGDKIEQLNIQFFPLTKDDMEH